MNLEKELASQTQNLARASVLCVEKSGSVWLAMDGGEQECFQCDVLEGRGNLGLSPGDSVLVWIDSDETKRPVVLGRIGPRQSRSHEPGETEQEPPDELMIEAKQNLTLRCGEGSITIRADGKILIKGKDLVSHAQRMNRIKGGSVSIN